MFPLYYVTYKPVVCMYLNSKNKFVDFPGTVNKKFTIFSYHYQYDKKKKYITTVRCNDFALGSSLV